MSRPFLISFALGAFAATSFGAVPPASQEIHELRRDVQMQSQKIEALTQQVLRLAQALEERQTARLAEPAPAPATTIAPVPAKAAAAEPVVEIPKAEPVTPSIQHVVEKGETLTSIAKRYNIPLPDLQKLNKITNERKLQIGQTLNVPAPKPAEPAAAKAVEAPANKTPEAPAEKNETP